MEPFARDALPGRVVFGAGAARTALAGEVGPARGVPAAADPLGK